MKIRILVFVLFAFLTGVGLVACDPSSSPPPGLYAAFLTPDGKIRTVFSEDGDSFKAGDSDVTHEDQSAFGPGIARDPESGIVTLAFFAESLSGITHLLVKTGLGPTIWETDPPDSIPTTTASAPAISYFRNGIFAIAWNNGQAIETASFNKQGLISTDTIDLDAVGTPTMASNGNSILMILKAAGGGNIYHSAVGTLSGEETITWQLNEDISLNNDELGWDNSLNLGNPSVTWDGTRYWLAAFGSEGRGGNTEARVIALLRTTDGHNDWRVESTCLIEPRNEPFGDLALSVFDDKVRMLMHRNGLPEVTYIDYIDGVCEKIARFDSTSSGQSTLVWSPIINTNIAVHPPMWVEQGPGKIISGQVEGINNRPVAGAVQSIALHPSNDDIMYIGTVGGGVWKTENAQAVSPNWIPLTDNMPSLSMGDVVFDPCDELGETLYVGTGRFSSGRFDGARVGVYETKDGGENWQIIGDVDLDGVTDIFSGTVDFADLNIRNLVAGQCMASGPPILLAGTQNGIYRGIFQTTTNSWNFFRIPLGPIGAACFTNPAVIQSGDINWLIRDTQDPNTFYAAVPGTPVQIFISTDNGTCWTPLSDPPIPGGDAVRLAMSETPTESGNPPLYVAVASRMAPFIGEIVSVARSIDGGITWGSMNEVTLRSGPRSLTTNPGGQAATAGHFTLAADPDDTNIAYVGGDRQPFPGNVASGTTDWSGNLFIGDWRITNSMWEPIVGRGANGTAPHADSRRMVFDSDGNLIESDDGGVYILRNPKQRADRRWESLNGNLRITQFYSVAWDSHNNVIFGGTQDNGSVEQMAEDGFQWREARLVSMMGQDLMTAEGDGGFVAADNHSNPDASIRYIMMNNYFFFYRREYPDPSPATNWGWILFMDPGNPDCVTQLPFCGLDDTERPDLNILDIPTTVDTFQDFINNQIGNFARYPVAVNKVEQNRVAVGINSIYESNDSGFSWQRVLDTPERTVALVYGGVEADGTPNPDVIIATSGTTNLASDLRVREHIGSVSIRTQLSDGDIRDIAVDPGNWRSVYYIDDNDVFHIPDITNPASGPIDLTGNPPPPPAAIPPGSINSILNDFRTIEVVRESGEIILLVGGEPINRTVMGTDSGGVARLRNADAFVTGGPLPTWTVLGTGLPNVITTDLHYNKEDDVLVAGTWGRGAWTLENTSDVVRQ